MRDFNFRSMSAAIIFVLALAAAQSIFAKDPTVEEIVKKHLESVGSADNLSKMTTMFTGGNVEFESKAPVIKGTGRAVIVSDPENFYFLMSFNSINYPFEKIGNFKGKVTLPFTVSGERSTLGDFLNEHQQIISENIFGGVLSMRWFRSINDIQKLKLRMTGSRKIGNQQFWTIEAQSVSRGSSEFKTRLFFDQKTFQHVRSEFRREVRAGTILNGRRNAFSDGYLLLIEQFSDFKTNEGVTLPTKYTINFQTDSPGIAHENSWRVDLVGARFNQQLAPDFFVF